MAILTPIGRVSYPTLFKPRAMDDNPESTRKWSLVLVFDDPSWAPYLEFKKKIVEIVKKEYGLADTVANILAGKFNGPKRLPVKFNWPWREAEDKLLDSGDYREGFPQGCEFISFTRNEDFGPPSHCGPDGETPLTARDVYAGMMGRVYTNPRCYKHPSGKVGLSCYLEAFQKTADGEPIGNAPVEASEVFSAVEPTSDGPQAEIDDSDLDAAF